MKKNHKIFSGKYSRNMWQKINALDAISTGDDVREALYLVCCRMQEMESRIRNGGVKNETDQE